MADNRPSRTPTPGTQLRIRTLDAILGSFFAVVVFWCIQIAAGATLGTHHRRVDTAGQAAQALRPLAGPWAGDVFAVGPLASALVALPVLMSTTAYVTGAQIHWRWGLLMNLREAPLFYSTLAAAAVLGTVVAFSGISPIQLLFLAGIIGGIATPVGLTLLLLVAANTTLMRQHPSPRPLLIARWTDTIAVTGCSLDYIVSQFTGPGI